MHGALAFILPIAAATTAACPPHVDWKSLSLESTLEPGQEVDVHVGRALFTPKEATALTRLAKSAAAQFDTRPDSTDGRPTFELHARLHGAVVAPKLWARVQTRVDSCLTPFVRDKFDCPSCVACTSLVRRYAPHERVIVNAHRDATSRVTVVVELQTAAPAHPEGSGLYIKQQDSTTEAMYPTLTPGDAFAHSYDLLHGVYVRCDEGGDHTAAALNACTRFSLIVWYHDSDEQCAANAPVSGYSAMLRRSADAGVPEGHYELGKLLLGGTRNRRGDGGTSNATEAVRHLSFAADANHSGAALLLGEVLRDGVGDALPPSLADAERWLERSLELGHNRAGTQLAALIRARGDAGAAGAERVEKLLRHAAERDDVEAQRELGQLLLLRAGSSFRSEAGLWLRKAGAAGDDDARRMLRDEL